MSKEVLFTTVPDIVVTSYLPKDPKKRKLRKEYHLRQMAQLSLFGKDLQIHGLYSGWKVREIGEIAAVFRKHLHPGFFSHHLSAGKVPKWEKHNIVLKALYDHPFGGPDKATLFLDDDVIPKPYSADEIDKGLVDTQRCVQNLLFDPDQMMGQVMFFACAGLRFDAYWQSTHPVMKATPSGCVGWAMLVRNDCGVLYTRELVEDPETKLVSTDYPFACACMAAGKVVVKHNRAFFKTFQNPKKEDECSTWVENHEDRILGRRLRDERMRRMFPQLFQKKLPKNGPAKVKRSRSGEGLGIR